MRVSTKMPALRAFPIKFVPIREIRVNEIRVHPWLKTPSRPTQNDLDFRMVVLA